MPETEFVLAQKSYWRDVDEAHFAWQTRGASIAAGEAALLSDVTVGPGERLLEVGCGEGANLFHLSARLGPSVRLYGVDFSSAKARFAREHTGCATAAADATRLPFESGRFDAVLIRDLLHHLPRPLDALAEAARVLRPGGALFLIEPSGRNPIIAAMAALIPAERGMLSSTATRVAGAARVAGFAVRSVDARQPMPLSRVLLHYKFGVPSLGALPSVMRALGALEGLFSRMPGALHSYFVIRAEKS